MSLDLSAEDRKALAKDLAAELDTGRYGSRFVLSRRQLLSIAGGSAGIAGLTALGVDPATAQSAAGQVGTQSSPEDVYAFDLDVQGALQRDLDAGGQAITNLGALSTGQTIIEQVSTDPNNPSNYIEDVSEKLMVSAVLVEGIVADNTTATIYDFGDYPAREGELIISGRLQGSSDIFVDKALIGGSSLANLNKNDLSGSPGNRVYSRSGTEIQVAIDDSGSLYDIGVQIVGARL